MTWKQKPQNNYNKCFPRYEIKYKDKCEQYNDKECKVNNVESCKEKEFRNCELVPKEDHERMCETVKEMHCELKRTVVEKEVESYVPKLKCHSLKSNISFYHLYTNENDKLHSIHIKCIQFLQNLF